MALLPYSTAEKVEVGICLDHFWQEGTIFGNQKWSGGPFLATKLRTDFCVTVPWLPGHYTPGVRSLAWGSTSLTNQTISVPQCQLLVMCQLDTGSDWWCRTERIWLARFRDHLLEYLCPLQGYCSEKLSSTPLRFRKTSHPWGCDFLHGGRRGHTRLPHVR